MATVDLTAQTAQIGAPVQMSTGADLGAHSGGDACRLDWLPLQRGLGELDGAQDGAVLAYRGHGARRAGFGADDPCAEV